MTEDRVARPGCSFVWVAVALVTLLLSGVVTRVEAHGGANRARAPAGCRSGYNTVIWRSAQYGVSNVVSDPFLIDDNGELFYDSYGIDDPFTCTMKNGSPCQYYDGATACHGACCSVSHQHCL